MKELALMEKYMQLTQSQFHSFFESAIPYDKFVDNQVFLTRSSSVVADISPAAYVANENRQSRVGFNLSVLTIIQQGLINVLVVACDI